MKLVLKIFGAVIALLIVAVVAIGLFFDPNDYKPQIQEIAREQAGIELQINGDIGWSLFPTLGLDLASIKANTLEGEPLASLNSAQLAVSIPALLGGEIKMSGITVDGLELSLTSSSKSVDSSAQPVDQNNNKDEQPATGVKLDIGDVVLKDANIRYTDNSSGQTFILSNVNFNGKNVSSSQPFDTSISFDFKMLQDNEPVVALSTQLKTQLALNTVDQVYELLGLDMSVDLQHEALGDKPQTLNLKGNLIADLGADKAAVSDLNFQLANLSIQGNIDVLDMIQQPRFQGSISIPSFDAKKLLAALGQPELQTQNSKALTAVSLNTDISGPANVLGLSNLVLKLDDTEFKGKLSHNLSSGAQQVQLAGNQINLDDYLPPASDQPAAKGSSSSSAAGEGYPKTPLLPVDTLKTLNFNADISLGKLLISGLTLTELHVLADAKGGLINARQVSGKLYNGSFNNSAVIDARKTPLAITANNKVEQMQVGGLLKDLAQQDKISGTFNLNGEFKTQGNSVHDIVNSVDGDTRMSLKNGRINGVNLIDKLCSGLLTLQGQKPDENAAVNYTEFSNLSASANIVNGLVSNKDLKAALVGVNLNGAGQVNLPQQALDYGLSLTVLQELKGPNCQIDKKLHNLSLPLRCKGSFDTEPTKLCGIDKEGMSQVLADLGAAEVKAKVEAKVEENKDKLENKVKDKLQGLFGR